MGPVLRIRGHEALTLHIQGLTGEQAAVVNDAVRGAGGGIAIDLRGTPAGTDVALTGPGDRLRGISSILASAPPVHQNLSQKIQSFLDNYRRSDYKIICRGRVLDLGSRTHIMGILNVTPDSFTDGGRYLDTDAAVRHARDMAAGGADIIDIGGESTRPGSEPVTEDEELARVIPVISLLAKEIETPLSVDTYKSRVAEKALQAGASLVNDISGLRFSPDMAKVVADHGAALAIMHIKGTPRNMQKDPVYADVVSEVMAYLDEGIELAVQAGVDREQVLIDPGIGFGKTLAHNLMLLDRLNEFRALGRPILLGTSRKSFIAAVLGDQSLDARTEGTAATVALGIERGARVLRVHDVRQMARVAGMADAILGNRTVE